MTVVLHVGGGVEGLDGLTPELAEWATVSAAVGAMPGEARTIVWRRAEQLAARHARQWQTEVAVVDGGDLRVFGAPERTPWGPGLVVAGFTVAVVVVALVALGTGLARSSPLLAVAAEVLVVGGLAPSAWMCRRVPVWRWPALGAVVGVALAWSGLLLSL